jgi:hypothetical protein
LIIREVKASMIEVKTSCSFLKCRDLLKTRVEKKELIIREVKASCTFQKCRRFADKRRKESLIIRGKSKLLLPKVLKTC